MKTFLSNNLAPIIAGIFVAVSAVSIFSYITFTFYKPSAQAYQPESQVKGVSDMAEPLDLPEMAGSTNLGITETTEGAHLSIEINRPLSEIEKYYEIILAERGWGLKKLLSENGIQVKKYEKDDEKLTLTISSGNDEVPIVGLTLTDK